MAFDFNPIPVESDSETCPAVAFQETSVMVPVQVKPYAKTGTTLTKCCGKATVKSGLEAVKGVKNGACYFTVAQDICVSVPVMFGASADVGDTYVTCMDASSGDEVSGCVCAGLEGEESTPTEPIAPTEPTAPTVPEETNPSSN